MASLAEMVSKIEAWIASLPPGEDGLPIVEAGGKMLSPIQVLELLRAGNPVGAEAYRKLYGETMNLDVSPQLVAARVEVRKTQRRLPDIWKWTLTGQAYVSSEQRVDNIKRAAAKMERGERLTQDELTEVEAEAYYMQMQLTLGGKSAPHGG